MSPHPGRSTTDSVILTIDMHPQSGVALSGCHSLLVQRPVRRSGLTSTVGAAAHALLPAATSARRTT
jgi:hypothetical protein